MGLRPWKTLRPTKLWGRKETFRWGVLHSTDKGPELTEVETLAHSTQLTGRSAWKTWADLCPAVPLFTPTPTLLGQAPTSPSEGAVTPCLWTPGWLPDPHALQGTFLNTNEATSPNVHAPCLPWHWTEVLPGP